MINLDSIDLSKLSDAQKIELLGLLEAQAEYEKYNRIKGFKPYKYQSVFYDANKYHRTRFLMAGNRKRPQRSSRLSIMCHQMMKKARTLTDFSYGLCGCKSVLIAGRLTGNLC